MGCSSSSPDTCSNEAVAVEVKKENKAVPIELRKENQAVAVESEKQKVLAKMDELRFCGLKTADDVCAYMTLHTSPELGEVFKRHCIKPQLLGKITDSDLQEMGVVLSIQRKQVLSEIETLLAEGQQKCAAFVQAKVAALLQSTLEGCLKAIPSVDEEWLEERRVTIRAVFTKKGLPPPTAEAMNEMLIKTLDKLLQSPNPLGVTGEKLYNGLMNVPAVRVMLEVYGVANRDALMPHMDQLSQRANSVTVPVYHKKLEARKAALLAVQPTKTATAPTPIATPAPSQGQGFASEIMKELDSELRDTLKAMAVEAAKTLATLAFQCILGAL